MKTPLGDFLQEHASKKAISFHMPGHKGAAIYERFGYSNFLKCAMDCDVTEIPGADNLFQTEGVIKEVQERYAKLYDVKKAYLLINGTSGGIIASILACVPKGKKIIMARNCHKSVFNALTLADVQPVYAYPDMMDAYGIAGVISPEQIERLLSENPDVEAVILPSPNYYGICSDIEKIAEITHRNGKVLIVDEAHGAHLAFFNRWQPANMPKAAEHCGADIVIASTHKTLASYTQSAILLLNSDRVEPYVLEDKLQCIQSTSPSYILMASLDINASILEEYGSELFAEWAANLDLFYEQAPGIPGLSLMAPKCGMDRSKLNFNLGIPGGDLERILIEEYGIFIELYTGSLVMCMTGMGNTRGHIEKLLEALWEIANKKKAGLLSGISTPVKGMDAGGLPPESRSVLCEIPREKCKTPLAESEGKICASSIIPYPPGIPLVCPGERLTVPLIEYIQRLRASGEKVIGVDEKGQIVTGK